MATKEEYLELRLVESRSVTDVAESCLHFEASIEVDVFAAHGTFLARSEIVEEFLEELDKLAAQLTPIAKLECGLVDATEEVIYFSCHIAPRDTHGDFVVQVSLGTGGSHGLLRRLHVGFPVPALSLDEFRHKLREIFGNRCGTAVLRQRREMQPNQRSQSTARV